MITPQKTSMNVAVDAQQISLRSADPLDHGAINVSEKQSLRHNVVAEKLNGLKFRANNKKQEAKSLWDSDANCTVSTAGNSSFSSVSSGPRNVRFDTDTKGRVVEVSGRVQQHDYAIVGPEGIAHHVLHARGTAVNLDDVAVVGDLVGGFSHQVP